MEILTMKTTKKVLIGCEMSGRVTAAMLDKGVNAYSCDIIPTIGPRPDRHIIGDIFDVLDGDKKKRTCLWLRGLPLLLPTTADGVGKPFKKLAIGSCPSQKKQHSLMSPFMAKAMSEQWADYLK